MTVQFKFHPDIPFYNVLCLNDFNISTRAMRIMNEYFECVLPVGDGNIKIKPLSTIPTLKSVYMYIQQDRRTEMFLRKKKTI